tara:strand:- start:346 stop:714 length:369 start_codon:yes stop_codon:yes gene_type:complete
MFKLMSIIFLLFNNTYSFNINTNNKIPYNIPIDNMICDTDNNDYMNSIPNYKIIHKLNKLHKNGYEINYWCNRNKNTGKNWSYFTERQLRIWGVIYTTLLMDKPENTCSNCIKKNCIHFNED